jgi:hypothetical protein
VDSDVAWRSRVVHLDVLTRLHTPVAKNALPRIIAVEGIGMILLIKIKGYRDRSEDSISCSAMLNLTARMTGNEDVGMASVITASRIC